MNNYHYIIAGLPALARDWKFSEGNFESFLEEIREGCSDKDRALIGWLERGFDDSSLNEGFYREALSCRNAFIREYFTFDLNVRNAKTRYLNKALGRPVEKDVIIIESEDGETAAGMFRDLKFPEEFEEAARLDAVLQGKDILARERGIDDLMWEKIDSLTTFNYFDINVLLGFLCKLHIISRWARLDEQTGREMFRKLVDEVRGTFSGVRYDAGNTASGSTERRAAGI